MSVDLRFVSTQPAGLDLRFGNVWGATPDYLDATLQATLPAVAMAASLVVELDNAVARGPQSWTISAWQEAERATTQITSPHGVTDKLAIEAALPLAEGNPLLADRGAAWEGMTVRTAAGAVLWQDAAHRANMVPDSWVTLSSAQRPTLREIFAAGAPHKSSAAENWISLFRDKRPEPVLPWGAAKPINKHPAVSFSVAARFHTKMDFPWGDGVRPAAGISPHATGGVTPHTPCYVPAVGPVHLLFRDPTASLNLVFKCPNAHGSTATIVVPVRSIYMQTNTVSLALASTGQPIPPRGGLRLSLDADSWTWGWSASVPASYLSVLSAPLGELVELIATVNGTAFRLSVERISRDRQFGQATLAISGRGRAAWLSDPYAEVVSRSNASAMTAQQLMNDALTENGVSIGWTLDWQITDWLVPSGAWNHTGTAMDACLAIAEAGGAYIQAHRTDQVLSVLPRYPAAPWIWPALTPDIELPEDACVVEGIEWADKPAYNTVFVSGQQDGILAHITRQGTAGDKAAPMVTDALTTHSDAGLQRGLRILSDTGRQKMISLNLQVLPETGIIVPGKLIRYSENGINHLGLTRAVDVSADFPKLRQTIKVESHVL